MWSSARSLRTRRFRHRTAQDELDEFQWLQHDGSSFGRHNVRDSKMGIDFEASFIIATGTKEDDEILSSYIKHNEQNIAMTTNINDIEVDDLFSSYNLNNIKKKFLYYDKIINEYDTNISSAYVDDNDLYYYKLPVVNDINADPTVQRSEHSVSNLAWRPVSPWIRSIPLRFFTLSSPN